MTEEIVQELRLLALETDESCGPGDVSTRIFEIIDKLEAASSAKATAAKETAEAETARRGLNFVKWAGLDVFCEGEDPCRGRDGRPHVDWTSEPHLCDEYGPCINPRPAEPLTTDVVLEVLRGKQWPYDLHWFDDLCHAWITADTDDGQGDFHGEGDSDYVALLRALDAAGVMDKARTAEVAKVAKEARR